MNADEPVYVSERSLRNLYQRYWVFADRVELQSHLLLHTFRVPFTQIAEVGESGPGIFSRLWCLKLDFADFSRHVYVVRKAGWIKTIKFTPDDPEAFLQALRQAMARDAT